MPRPRLRATPKRPPLNIDEILRWADEWFAEHGMWPNVNSGWIPGTIDDTWAGIDDDLRNGHRGLPKRTRPRLSLARLLAQRRGVRNSEYPPRLSVKRVLSWVRAHYRRTGEWPTEESGPIAEAPGETWLAIDMALRKGRRGFKRGSSLPRFLARHCLVRNPQQLPPLSERMILKWADAYFAKHGKRPLDDSGLIPGTIGETWCSVDKALSRGKRGLPGGLSLAAFLAQQRPEWFSRVGASRRHSP